MKNKLIFLSVFLIFVMTAFAFASNTYTLKSPANYFLTTSTSVTFNFTVTSTNQANIAAYLFLGNGSGSSVMILNQTIICANATHCNTTKTLSVGQHKWNIKFNGTNGNTTSTYRWFEIRNTNDSDYFTWKNETGFVDMLLNKNTGDLNVTGNLVCKGTTTFLGNINAGNNNITASWFFGWFNWTTDSYSSFNGIKLSANETKLNNTFVNINGDTMTGNLNMSNANLTNVNAINPSTTILNIFASQTFFWSNINMTNKNITKVSYINPMGDELRVGGNLNITQNISQVNLIKFPTVTQAPTCTSCIYNNGTGLMMVG